MQKSFALSSVAVVAIIIAAGTLGPSAASVAYADAQEIVGRGFERIANLSDEDRAALEERFQEGIRLHGEKGFMGMHDLSPEEIEAHNKEIKASLADTLTEAKNATDLQVVSADEMPVGGFIGRAGRAFGMPMMHDVESFEEKLSDLPEDVRQHIEEREKFHEDMKPTSFLMYTNADGEEVTLGVNANDEPVIKFIQSEDGELPFPPHPGPGMHGMMSGRDSE